MKYIISGTNRPQSNTFKVCQIISSIYEDLGESVGILNLRELTLPHKGSYKCKENRGLEEMVQRVVESEGLILVSPEYNGSFPGVLKYFIDHWPFPEAFEFRPLSFVGLSAGYFGALRSIEQLQHIFAYRNALQYPERVFIPGIHTQLAEDGTFKDKSFQDKLISQAKGFCVFMEGLQKLRQIKSSSSK